MPTDIAKTTNINRATVYSIAKELIKKAVIAEDLGGKSRYLVALPPQDLDQLVKKEEKKIEQKFYSHHLDLRRLCDYDRH